MTAVELETACRHLFGDHGGARIAMARELGVDPATVRRWCKGEQRVPGPVAAAVRCWLERQVVMGDRGGSAPPARRV
jgi:DNA-binding transcriptional regulator YdaS (Cro superfamily)